MSTAFETKFKAFKDILDKCELELSSNFWTISKKLLIETKLDDYSSELCSLKSADECQLNFKNLMIDELKLSDKDWSKIEVALYGAEFISGFLDEYTDDEEDDDDLLGSIANLQNGLEHLFELNGKVSPKLWKEMSQCKYQLDEMFGIISKCLKITKKLGD